MVAISRPKTLNQTLDTLASGEHILFAGGTDLMVRHRIRPNVPPKFEQHIVFTDTIAELKQSLVKIAAPALRNRVTIAGNICNASPAADTLPPLYLMDAKLVLSRLGRCRILPISDFILGPEKTDLQVGELLTHIEIPHIDMSCYSYHKVGTRAANALTKISFAGGVKVFDNQVIDWRVAFGAVGPTVIRDKNLEAGVIGQSVDKFNEIEFVDKLLAAYGRIICPYRRTTALNLLKRFILSIGL